MRLAQVLALAATLAAPERWAGHQVLGGRAKVPFVGELPTRVESYLLAEVERGAEALVLTVRVCRVRMAPLGPVQASMAPARLGRLTPVVAALAPAGAASWQGSWLTRWRADDEDGDGHPGVTVHVEVPACSGDVYLTTRSLTHMDARLDGDGLTGTLRVAFHQEQLGASNLCLRLGGAAIDDQLAGAVRFVPVAPGSTCSTLRPEDWPAVPSP